MAKDLGKVCFTSKGTWEKNTEYEKLDLVVHEGSSYVALKDVPASAVTPPNNTGYWLEVATGAYRCAIKGGLDPDFKESVFNDNCMKVKDADEIEQAVVTVNAATKACTETITECENQIQACSDTTTQALNALASCVLKTDDTSYVTSGQGLPLGTDESPVVIEGTALVTPAIQAVDNEVKVVTKKTDKISTEFSAESEEKISIQTEGGVDVVDITEGGVNVIGELKNNDYDVLTTATGASKSDIDNKQDKIKQISIEGTPYETEEQTFCNDDETEEYASIGSYGIRAKNLSDTLVLDADEICEYYAINSSGNHVLATGYGCSHYIICDGASTISVMMIQETTASGYGLAFYDSNKALKLFIANPIGEEQGVKMMEITVPSGAVYFRTTYYNFEQATTYGDFSGSVVLPKGVLGDGNKRPYQSGNIYFSQRVNQAVNRFWESPLDELTIEEDYLPTTGVLLLPTTYKKIGKKTPLIMYCHGYSHAVYYGTWGSTDTFQEQKEHWAEMGFAVFDCNGAYATRTASGDNNFAASPQNVSAYYQCLKYVQNHYNVEDTIYVVGGSMGGQPMMGFAYTHTNLVRAIALLEPHCNSRYWMSGNSLTDKMQTRFKALFGISDDEYTAATERVFDDPTLHERFVGYLIEDKIETIDGVEYIRNFPPTRLWYGTSYSSKMDGKRTINAIRNANGYASMRYIAMEHSQIVSGAEIIVDTEVANWLKTY